MFRRKFFGRSSERYVDDTSQLRLFESGDEQRVQDKSDDDPQEDVSKGKRRRKKKPEKNLAHLRRKVVEADVSPDQRKCSCCGEVLGVNDTTVRLQDPSLPGKMRTARFWLYRGGEDHPYDVFDFTESRGCDGPASFLSDFSGHAVSELCEHLEYAERTGDGALDLL